MQSMKRQISCIFGAAIISAGIIAGCNYMAEAQKIVSEEFELSDVVDDDLSVGDYAKDNYSGSDFWKTNNYEPVEYVETSGDIAEFKGKLEAKAAILVDVDTKTVIYSKNPDEEMAPASTTKLATAITATAILDADEVIEVGNEINLIAPDSSKAGIKAGDRFTFEELLEAMLLSSGNDAAYVIARAGGQALLEDNIAYDNEEITIEQCIKRFVYEMNKNVRDIGLENTCFTSPDGYDQEGQYTTARDLSKIAMVAYETEQIKNICSMDSVTAKNGEYTWSTTNELLKEDSKYYYKYAMGMKTGSTDKAGKCLVSVAQKDEQRCISVVLNSTEEGRYEDSLRLLKFYIE